MSVFEFLKLVSTYEGVKKNLENEKVDTDALKGLKIEDLRELGFKMGERSKILQANQPSSGSKLLLWLQMPRFCFNIHYCLAELFWRPLPTVSKEPTASKKNVAMTWQTHQRMNCLLIWKGVTPQANTSRLGQGFLLTTAWRSLLSIPVWICGAPYRKLSILLSTLTQEESFLSHPTFPPWKWGLWFASSWLVDM